MFYAGDPLGPGDVKLVMPTPKAVARASNSETDDAGAWSRWVTRAPDDPTILYFAVERAGGVVGEIFLHDIDHAKREAMVGYRVFDGDERGAGTGRSAIASLVDWVASRSEFDRLFIIARADNVASRRLAEGAGFVHRGAAREDANRVVYERRFSAHPDTS